MNILEFRNILKKAFDNIDLQEFENKADKIYYRIIGRKEGMENALILLDSYIDKSLDEMYNAMREDRK